MTKTTREKLPHKPQKYETPCWSQEQPQHVVPVGSVQYEFLKMWEHTGSPPRPLTCEEWQHISGFLEKLT